MNSLSDNIANYRYQIGFPDQIKPKISHQKRGLRRRRSHRSRKQDLRWSETSSRAGAWRRVAAEVAARVGAWRRVGSRKVARKSWFRSEFDSECNGLGGEMNRCRFPLRLDRGREVIISFRKQSLYFRNRRSEVALR